MCSFFMVGQTCSQEQVVFLLFYYYPLSGKEHKYQIVVSKLSLVVNRSIKERAFWKHFLKPFDNPDNYRDRVIRKVEKSEIVFNSFIGSQPALIRRGEVEVKYYRKSFLKALSEVIPFDTSGQAGSFRQARFDRLNASQRIAMHRAVF